MADAAEVTVGDVSRAGDAVTVVEASTPQEAPVSIVTTLQGLSEVSEADLMGFDPDASEEPPASSEPLVPEEKKPEEKAPEAKPPEEAPPEEAPAEKPPKGYVPLAAVQEVRGENKYLKEQIATLSAKLDRVIAQPPPEAKPVVPSKFAEFKELSDADFNALADESAADALAYMKTLGEYKDYKRDLADQQKAQEASTAYAEQIFAATTSAMEEAVPGLFEEDSTVAAEFRDFAIGIGFTDDMFYLTNPATQIILPGTNEPLLLGEQAAQIVKLLATIQKKGTPPAPAPAIDPVKLEAELRTKIEAELLTKLKKTTPGFRSLSDVPASEETRPEFDTKALSEAQFAKLSPKEQELYLAGA